MENLKTEKKKRQNRTRVENREGNKAIKKKWKVKHGERMKTNTKAEETKGARNI